MNCGSDGSPNVVRLGENGEGAEEVAALIGADDTPRGPFEVSNFVMANVFGTLLEPLAFLFFDIGPEYADGDACRERLRDVTVVEVPCDAGAGVAMFCCAWCCVLKPRCKFCKSEVDCEWLKLLTGADTSRMPSVLKGLDADAIRLSDPFEICVVKDAGMLCVL